MVKVDIGIIGYLSKDKNEGYITVISADNYSEKISITPSEINFGLNLSQLLVIAQINSLKKYYEFDPNNHSELLDLELLKRDRKTISVIANKNNLEFIIDNELEEHSNEDLRNLREITKLIKYNSGYPPTTVQMNNLEELIEKYEITYSEGGYNKPGDWSKAWIHINTRRPSNLSENKLDAYLNKLLPNFDLTLGESDDCIEYKFKNDILT